MSKEPFTDKDREGTLSISYIPAIAIYSENARLDPLFEKLEALESDDDDLDSLLDRVEAVIIEYRKLKGKE